MIIIVGKECPKDIKYLSEYSNEEYPAKISKNIQLVFHTKEEKNGKDKHIFTNVKGNKIDIKKLLNKHKTVFRYGCRALKLKGLNKVVYNNSASIKMASDKYNSRLLFKSNGIPIPNTYSCIEVHQEDIKFPIIRRPIKHSKSKDFTVINSREELNNFTQQDVEIGGFYYSEFIDKVREIRVHVAHGKIITIVEKRPPINKQYSWGMVDNFDNIKWGQWRKDIVESSISSVKTLGLTFGAVDVIIDKSGNYYILEVNTAPDFSYSNYLTSKMIKYFNWVAGDEKRKSWLKVEKDKASNFAWKKTDF